MTYELISADNDDGDHQSNGPKGPGSIKSDRDGLGRITAVNATVNGVSVPITTGIKRARLNIPTRNRGSVTNNPLKWTDATGLVTRERMLQRHDGERPTYLHARASVVW